MSFQAYIDNIKKKTGKSPEDFMMLMQKKGIFSPDMKASVLVSFLAQEFDLGHGHAMAIWAVFKAEGWVAKKS